MKNRVLVFSLLFALLLMVMPSVSAQDTCFGLSADDCAAINTASANTLNAGSFNQSFTFDLSITAQDTDVHITASGEGPLVESDSPAFPFNLDVPVTVTSTTNGEETTTTTEIRIVDGIVYIKNPDPASDQWGGIDIAAAMANPAAMGIPVNPTQLTDPAAMGLDPAALGAALPAFEKLAATPGFLTYVRDGDTFTFKADAGVLVNSPDYMAAVTALTQATANNEQLAGMTPMLPALPMLLKEGTLTVSQTIDGDAVTDLNVALNSTIDLSMVSGNKTPIVIALNIHVTFSQLGEDFTFEVPANVQMAPTGN